MGEVARSEAEEIKAIEAAIQMGYRLIDTAEMYARFQGQCEIEIKRSWDESYRGRLLG